MCNNVRKSLKPVWVHYENAADKAHDIDHITTVLSNAVMLAREEFPNEVCLQALGYACILHDIAREDDFLHGTDIHEIAGAERSYEYTGHFDKDVQDLIADAIRNHRNRTGNPKTVMARILADADRLPAHWGEYVTRTFLYNYCNTGDYTVALMYGYRSMCKRFRNSDPAMHTVKGAELAKAQLATLRSRVKSVEDYEAYVNRYLYHSDNVISLSKLRKRA